MTVHAEVSARTHKSAGLPSNGRATGPMMLKRAILSLVPQAIVKQARKAEIPAQSELYDPRPVNVKIWFRCKPATAFKLFFNENNFMPF
jgi:hypothetical protein